MTKFSFVFVCCFNDFFLCFSTFLFVFVLASLLWIMGELAGGLSVAVAVGVSDIFGPFHYGVGMGKVAQVFFGN